MSTLEVIGCELPQGLADGNYNLMDEGATEKGAGRRHYQPTQRQGNECMVREKVTWVGNPL